ncbi:MAG: WG repeat-containing protein [Bacteroidia bacterium]
MNKYYLSLLAILCGFTVTYSQQNVQLDSVDYYLGKHYSIVHSQTKGKVLVNPMIYGVLNTKGDTILPFIYQRVAAIPTGGSSNYFEVVNQAGKIALFDENFRSLTGFIYEEIKVVYGIAWLKKGEKYDAYHLATRKFASMSFDYNCPFASCNLCHGQYQNVVTEYWNCVPFRKDSLTYLYNFRTDKVSEGFSSLTLYTPCDDTVSKVQALVQKKGKFGLLDLATFELSLPCKFEGIGRDNVSKGTITYLRDTSTYYSEKGEILYQRYGKGKIVSRSKFHYQVNTLPSTRKAQFYDLQGKLVSQDTFEQVYSLKTGELLAIKQQYLTQKIPNPNKNNPTQPVVANGQGINMGFCEKDNSPDSVFTNELTQKAVKLDSLGNAENLGTFDYHFEVKNEYAAPYDASAYSIFLFSEKRREQRILDNTGNWFAKLGEYDNIEKPGNHYILTKNKKFALYSADLQPLSSFKYDSLYLFDSKREWDYGGNNTFIAQQKDTFTVFFYDGKDFKHFPIPDCDSIQPVEHYSKEVIVFKNGKQGLYDIEGKRIVPPLYQHIDTRNIYNWTFIAIDSGQHKVIYSYFKGRIFAAKAENVVAISHLKLMLIQDDKAFIISPLGEILKTIDLTIPFNKKIVEDINNEDSPVFFEYKGKQGLIFSHDTMSISEYDEIEIVMTRQGEDQHFTRLFQCKKADKIIYFDDAGNQVEPPSLRYTSTQIDSTENYQKQHILVNNYIIIKSEAKYGYIDSLGKTLIPFEYDAIGAVQWGQMALPFLIASKNKKINLFDLKGKLILQNLDYAIQINDVISALKNGKLGLIDAKGNVTVPFEYETLSGISEGVYLAQKAGKYGFIDAKNQVIEPLKYKNLAYPFSLNTNDIDTDYYIFKEKGKYLVFNEYGKKCEVFSAPPKVCHFIKEGIISKFLLVKTQKYQHSESGKRLPKGIYIENAAGDMYITTNKLPLLNDNLGEDNIIEITDNQIPSKSKAGLIDINGTVLLEMKYDYVRLLNNKSVNLFLFGKGNQVGVYNAHLRKIVVPLQEIRLEEQTGFNLPATKYLYAVKNNRYAVWDTNFQELIPALYESIVYVGNDKFVALKDKKCGVINAQNQVLIPFKYDGISQFAPNVYSVKLDCKYGIVNEKDSILKPIEYELITNMGYHLSLQKEKNKESFSLLEKLRNTRWEKHSISPFLNKKREIMGYLAANDTLLYHCLDTNFQEILPKTYRSVICKGEYLLALRFENGKTTQIEVYDLTGKKYDFPEFTRLLYYNNDSPYRADFVYEKDGKRYFVYPKGVIKCWD